MVRDTCLPVVPRFAPELRTVLGSDTLQSRRHPSHPSHLYHEPPSRLVVRFRSKLRATGGPHQPHAHHPRSEQHVGGLAAAAP
jgi:hypothetical protein